MFPLLNVTLDAATAAAVATGALLPSTPATLPVVAAPVSSAPAVWLADSSDDDDDCSRCGDDWRSDSDSDGYRYLKKHGDPSRSGSYGSLYSGIGGGSGSEALGGGPGTQGAPSGGVPGGLGLGGGAAGGASGGSPGGSSSGGASGGSSSSGGASGGSSSGGSSGSGGR